MPADRTPDPSPILTEELAFFDARRADLLRDHRGKYALIKGQELIGTFDTDETAYTEGVARFGREPFLVRRIEEHNPTAQFPALTCGWLRGINRREALATLGALVGWRSTPTVTVSEHARLLSSQSMLTLHEARARLGLPALIDARIREEENAALKRLVFPHWTDEQKAAFHHQWTNGGVGIEITATDSGPCVFAVEPEDDD